MKKVLAILMAFVLLTSLLVGCGSSTGTETDNTVQTQKAESDNQSKPVALKFFNWYSSNDGQKYLDELSETVAANYPNIKLEYESVNWDNMHATLQTRIAGNEIPDLIDFKGQDVPKYGKAGNLIDLTDEDFMKEIPTSATENTKVDGKIYGLPYTALYQGVFYNKKIFADNGLEIPETYDELIKITATLKSKNIAPFTTHYKDTWNIGNITMQFAMVEVFSKNPNWGKDLYAGKVTFASSPEYRAVFQYAKDQYDNSWKDSFAVDQTEALRRFAKGEAAMYVTGTWTPVLLEKTGIDIDYGIFPFPGKEPGAKLIFEPNHTWSGAATTKHKDEVMKVLRLVATDKELAKICSDTIQEHSLLKGVQSAKKSSLLDDINKYKDSNEIVDVSIGNVQIKWQYQEEYSRYIAEWLLGKKSLDDALKAADDYKSKVKVEF